MKEKMRLVYVCASIEALLHLSYVLSYLLYICLAMKYTDFGDKVT